VKLTIGSSIGLWGSCFFLFCNIVDMEFLLSGVVCLWCLGLKGVVCEIDEKFICVVTWQGIVVCTMIM
jgi:hypothetical protein